MEKKSGKGRERPTDNPKENEIATQKKGQGGRLKTGKGK